MNVTVRDMMLARDRRAARQQALLSRYGQTLLCFTMNIPGPVKDSPLIRRGFSLGQAGLRRAFLRLGVRPLYEEEAFGPTGCEGYYVLPLTPEEAKRMAADLEEAAPSGRLFDLDVLRPDGRKVDRQEIGLPGRRCLICGGPAQACARARTHTAEALQEKTRALLLDAVRAAVCERAASLCCRALLFEVGVTPKPGLVDREGSGSHRDMDIFTFFSSTSALSAYFARCAAAGFALSGRPAPETLEAVRPLGRMAEGAMLEATGGVNTHKGAVFSLGLLAAAAGRLRTPGPVPADDVLGACRDMTAGLTARDFAGLTEETARTAGQRFYLRFGAAGVRGEAEAGFPLVRDCGLPKLREALARGLSPNDAGCAALLAIMARNPDTNVFARGGEEALREVRAKAAALLEAEPFPSRASLRALGRELTARNLSPGGSADLLALCFFLHFEEEEP